MNKRAVILAGGKGTRLRPYTAVFPKALMPIGEIPILEIIIRQLAANGFDRITMAVNHQAELIRLFCGDGSRWNVQIDYSLEPQPLGTMGPLKLIPDLPEHFLVMNGDVLTDLNFSEFYAQHVEENRLFTISSYKRVQQVDYGVLRCSSQGNLDGFQEKPTIPFEVSMGIYLVSRDIIAQIPNGTLYGFDNLMRDLLIAEQPVTVRQFSGYWLDIGRPDDYTQAMDEFERQKHRFLID